MEQLALCLPSNETSLTWGQPTLSFASPLSCPPNKSIKLNQAVPYFKKKPSSSVKKKLRELPQLIVQATVCKKKNINHGTGGSDCVNWSLTCKL